MVIINKWELTVLLKMLSQTFTFTVSSTKLFIFDSCFPIPEAWSPSRTSVLVASSHSKESYETRYKKGTITQYLHAPFYPEIFSYVLFPWCIGEEIHFSFIENTFFPETNFMPTWKKKMMSLNSICLQKLSQCLCLWRQKSQNKKFSIKMSIFILVPTASKSFAIQEGVEHQSSL